MRFAGPRTLLALAAPTTLALAALAAPDGATAGLPEDAEAGSVVVNASVGATNVPEAEVDALTTDLHQLRNPSDLTVDDLADQQRFADVVSGFETNFPDDYVGAGVPTADSDRYWIRVKHRPSQAELDALDGLPVDVEVRFGAAASAAEFEQAAFALSSAFTKEFGADTGIMVGPAANGSAIEVRYDNHMVTAEEIRSIASRVMGDAIPISLVPGGPIRLSLFASMEGGRQLRLQSDNSAQCTSGFTVDRNNGNPGLITAGHCPDNLKYKNAAGTLAFGATATGGVDMQFHRRLSGSTVHPRFRANAGDVRKVLGYGNSPNNTLVCKWGQDTGYSCGTVIDQNQCFGSICGLDVVDGLHADHGDSGGPVFVGNDARGIVTGAINSSGVIYDVITRIGRVQSNMAATVRTTTP